MIKKETKYIIRRILISVGVILLLSFIRTCEVYAETLSDTIIRNNLYFRKGNSGDFSALSNTYTSFNTYYNGNLLQLRGQTFIEKNVIIDRDYSIIPQLYGRYTLCMESNAVNQGYNVQNTDEVNWVNTSIPCYLSGAPDFTGGYVVFATFKILNTGFTLNNYDEATGYETPIYIIGTTFKRQSVWTTIAYQVSINEFETYSEEDALFKRVDSILSTLNSIQSTINSNTTSIINSLTSQTTSITSAITTMSDWITQAQNNTTSAINTNTNSLLSKINDVITKIQEQIEKQKVCKKIQIDKNNTILEGNLTVNGGIATTQSNIYGVTDYISINSDIKILNVGGLSNYMCFYNESYTLLSCDTYNNLKNSNNIITKPNNAKYARFTINKNTNLPILEVEECKNGNQAITDTQQQTNNSIKDMNDTIKNDNVDSPNSSISQMEQNLPTNSVISDLLTLPIRMFQNILNAVNGTCSPFSLGALFGTNLVLPCINIQNYLGFALWSAIDVIFCGIFVLSMRKKFVEIFENITSLKNGGNELE